MAKFDNEHRAKLSKAHRDKPSPNKGHHLSEEQKAEQSRVQKVAQGRRYNTAYTDEHVGRDIAEGLSVRQIVEKEGISYAILKGSVRRLGLPMPPKYRRLPSAHYSEIREALKRGEAMTDIARNLGISTKQVKTAKNRLEEQND